MRLLILTAAALIGGGVLQAGYPATGTMASGTARIGDETFVRKAAISDMYEVEAGKLARQKAVSADAKTFAGKMVDAHTQTTDRLKSILSSKPNLKPPSAMDADHKALLAKLRAAKGAQFDKLYAQQQAEAHNDAVMLFTDYSQNGKDPDLKTFATDTLPTIQQHLAMAQTLEKGGAAP
jgi:putative membrane protein